MKDAWMRDGADLLKELRIEKRQRQGDRGDRERWRWLVLAFLLLSALAVVSAWWTTSRRAMAVQTASAVSSAIGQAGGTVLQATGYVTARRQATVSAQITGTLTAVLIEEGDRVTRGQVLARLDNAQYKAALVATQTQAAAAHALVAQYRAQLLQDERDAHRNEELAARGLVAKQVAEQTRTLVDAARAKLIAQRKLAESDDAQVNEARVNFDYCIVRAPFDGVITTKDAQVGEIVSPFSAGGGFTRTGIGTIVDMDSLEVDVDVNEAYIGRVKPDMSARAVLDAYPNWEIPAHVIAIVPAADRGKATVKVRVALEEKDLRVVPNMGVHVSFFEAPAGGVKPLSEGVLVPAKAIAQRSGQSVVFVVNGGKAQERIVHTEALSDGQLVLIPTELHLGDEVVLAPPLELHDGAQVRTENPPINNRR